MPIVTQQLFKDYHLTVDHFEGYRWTMMVWFSVVIPAGTTINSVMCRLRTSKHWATTIFGIVFESKPCVEVGGEANVFELNGYTIWDKPVHVNKVVEGDGKLYLVSGDNSARICLRKTAPMITDKLDQIFDAWIDIDYTGEAPSTGIERVTEKEEAGALPAVSTWQILALLGLAVFVVLIIIWGVTRGG